MLVCFTQYIQPSFIWSHDICLRLLTNEHILSPSSLLLPALTCVRKLLCDTLRLADYYDVPGQKKRLSLFNIRIYASHAWNHNDFTLIYTQDGPTVVDVHMNYKKRT